MKKEITENEFKEYQEYQELKKIFKNIKPKLLEEIKNPPTIAIGKENTCGNCKHWLNRRCEELETNADIEIYNHSEFCDEGLQIHTPHYFSCNHHKRGEN